MEAAGRPSGPEPVFGFKLGAAFGCDEAALRRARSDGDAGGPVSEPASDPKQGGVLWERSLCHPKFRADFLQRCVESGVSSLDFTRLIPYAEKRMLRKQAAPEEVARMRAEIQMIVAARTASEEAELREAAELRSMLAEDVAPDDFWLEYVDPQTGLRVYRNVSALARGAVVDDERAVTERPAERAPPPEAKTSTPLAACSVCAQPTAAVCGECKCVRFCSRECMKKSWSTHRLKCDVMKRVRMQIKRGKMLELSGHIGSSADDLARVAAWYAHLVTVKEPSRRANGRLRGKQSRCSISSCKNRDAVGVRYVYTGSASTTLDRSTRQSTCAPPRPPIARRMMKNDIAGENCWLDMLKLYCGSRLRVNKSGALTGVAHDKTIMGAINAGVLKI